MLPLKFNPGILFRRSFNVLGKNRGEAVNSFVGTDVKLLHGGILSVVVG